MVASLGAAFLKGNPLLGVGLIIFGVVQHREIDRFFRYQCPECGAALEILAQLV